MKKIKDPFDHPQPVPSVQHANETIFKVKMPVLEVCFEKAIYGSLPK